jgi:hypothetical protein
VCKFMDANIGGLLENKDMVRDVVRLTRSLVEKAPRVGSREYQYHKHLEGMLCTLETGSK